MKDLVTLIERYRPGYSATIVPASSIEIEDFEEEAGPLPGAYVRFLQTMGRSIGDFDVHGLDFDVQKMLLAYQLAPWIVRDQYLRIASDSGPTGVSYYMDRAKPYGKDDCMIVRMLDPNVPREQCERVHAGLEEFLYVEAYRTVRLPLFDQQAELSMAPLSAELTGKADHVCAIAEQLGFIRVPPASRSALYERGDAAIVLYRHPVDEDFSFRIASANAGELTRMIAIFKDAIGVKFISD